MLAKRRHLDVLDNKLEELCRKGYVSLERGELLDWFNQERFSVTSIKKIQKYWFDKHLKGRELKLNRNENTLACIKSNGKEAENYLLIIEKRLVPISVY